MSAKVLVTGANGFIASHAVKYLLSRGFTVVGTVRDPRNEGKTRHIQELEGASDRLTLVPADLTASDPFGPWVSDVDYVLHLASPYVVNVDDPQRDLVEPALRGTEAILNACANSDRVRRVVLTSSVAAITDEPDASHVLTEKDWNDKSSLTRNPYYYSKVQAEQAAWAFMKQRRPSWDLVVINPFFTIGPSLGPSVNTSNQVFLDMLAGQYPMIMSLAWGLVDVRDVAEAHVTALTEEHANGRYLCAAETRSMVQVVSELRRLGYSHKLPRLRMDGPVGTCVARLAARAQPSGVRSYLETHLGRIPRFDNSKIKKELGVDFRSAEETLRDTMEDLERWGHISKLKKQTGVRDQVSAQV